MRPRERKPPDQRFRKMRCLSLSVSFIPFREVTPYNTIGIPIAAGVLFPFFGVLLSPVIAAAAMSFSSVSVVGNALRLRGVRV